MTDSKTPVVTIDNKEYAIDDLNPNQRYILVQIQEVSNDIRSLNMKVEQLQAALGVFKSTFIKSLDNSDE
tara:strand:- start:11183 stop:11392 length:210 start_codon:yes stop_codon:yes gene_type:complete